MMTTGIEARRLSLWFKQGKRGSLLKVLDCVDLEVQPGEFVVVLGPSGCGKTSLLKLLGGLISPSSDGVILEGKVTVAGQSPLAARRDRMFGFAFQNSALMPWRNVRRNVVLPLEMLRVPTNVDWQHVEDILQLMDVKDFSDSYPAMLSGGMQQRVNIARAIIHEPSVLLMDEPFGSLDEVTRERLNIALHNIQRTKKHTVIFVTHNIREAVLLADRVLILSKRPASIVSSFDIDLPTKRSADLQMSPEYLLLCKEVKDTFFMAE